MDAEGKGTFYRSKLSQRRLRGMMTAKGNGGNFYLREPRGRGWGIVRGMRIRGIKNP
jgi:hypothetical protein